MRTVVGYFPQTLLPIIYVFLNFDRNFANLVAPSTDGSAKRLVRYKSTCGPVTDDKTVFKSMHNWRRYPSSNWYEIDQKRGSKFGALLWRHLTPQTKTAI